jgi:hypothetical protein
MLVRERERERDGVGLMDVEYILWRGGKAFPSYKRLEWNNVS